MADSDLDYWLALYRDLLGRQADYWGDSEVDYRVLLEQPHLHMFWWELAFACAPEEEARLNAAAEAFAAWQPLPVLSAIEIVKLRIRVRIAIRSSDRLKSDDPAGETLRALLQKLVPERNAQKMLRAILVDLWPALEASCTEMLSLADEAGPQIDSTPPKSPPPPSSIPPGSDAFVM